MVVYHQRRPQSQKSCFRVKTASQQPGKITDRSTHEKAEPSSTSLRDRGMIGDVIDDMFHIKTTFPNPSPIGTGDRLPTVMTMWKPGLILVFIYRSSSNCSHSEK